MINRKMLTFSLGILFFYIHSVIASECIKTVVVIRHGEINQTNAKGQLNCQGLNRALALRQVLETRYGEPAAIYAPNPNITLPDNNRCYTYPRPLATIEPTAIYFNKPVLTQFGVGSVGGPVVPNDQVVPCTNIPPNILPLPQSPSPRSEFQCGLGGSDGDFDIAREILKTNAYCGKTVFVAWEHYNIPIITYSFFYLLGLNPINKIPIWPYGPCLYSYCTPGTCSQEYNFDTIYVLRINQGSHPAINIALENENLNGQSTTCPD